MFFKILLKFFSGFITLKIEGYYVERFINICISKGIFLWNLKREKSTLLYTNIGINDFKKIKQIARKTKCKIKIIHKRGLTILANKYKKRKTFALLFVLVIIFMLIASNFVWNIQIIGDGSINIEEISKSLEENGLKVGIFKNKINSKEIINKIRLKRDDIAWMGIKIDGTNVVVEIKEAQKKPDLIDENEFCKIVSNKYGVITKISVQEGTAKVTVGDVIKKGDVLVEGIMEGKYTEPRYVHSKADIEAKVWYSKKEKMMLNQTEYVKNDNIQNIFYIKFNNLRINFNKSIPKFKNYDTISDEKRLKIFSNFYLPIELGKITYIETIKQNKIYSEEEAKTLLENKLKEELNYEIEKQENIVNTKTNFKIEQEYVEAEVIYEVLENIGTKEKY